ncbi:MAG TPA: ATP:cob(I)alamin adenosyltransferase [Candidatus Hydrogenedens sp.]|nr:ATP:cob(I)alamin adenosyltransferase [Candidatus Hydrogenedens sp.]HOL19871.1 ATP:cob(I)alamin adenosyltransferase [Candidatus Hydrogenedens sp.]HPP59794.1 ATP:cob(I)alamin adenosyltransferase [Candidatus Hydrogenedens sp.]
MKKSYVTTKQGDKGKTKLPDGHWVLKDSEIIECLGSLDSLRVNLSYLRLQILQSDNPHKIFLSETLLWLIHCCFITGTQISDPSGVLVPSNHPRLSQKHLNQLEQWQAQLEEQLQLPRKFIASANNPISAYADIVTTVAREFERRLITLKKNQPETINEVFVPFYNRLSDFLFIIARILDNDNFNTVDYTLIQ